MLAISDAWLGEMEKHSLLNDDSIRAWIADNEPDGIGKLAHKLHVGEITGARARYTSSFLSRLAAEAEAIAANESLQRAERATLAAESSARWSKWSLVVAVVSLIVATFAYLRP